MKHRVAFAILVLVALASRTMASDDATSRPAAWMEQFSANWDESAWTGGRRAYMRPLEDDGWKLRMRTLQGLSQLGASAEAQLLRSLEKDDAPARILAAQAIGYLGSDVSAALLVDLLKKEPDAAVRLYLVDAIGMSGGGLQVRDHLEQWRSQERNRDVKKHIGYATEWSNRPATFIVDKLGLLRYARLGKSFGDRPRPDEVIDELRKLGH